MTPTELIHDEKQIVSLSLFKHRKPFSRRFILSESGTVVADRNEPVEQDVAGEERLRLESRGHERLTSYSTPDNTLNG